MMGKLKWLVGFGAGYVLGARAGRGRYDQIAGKAQELWSDPRVQERAGQAQQMVKATADQAQQVVKEKVAEKTVGNGTGPVTPATSGANRTRSRSSSAAGSRSGGGSGTSS
jgi:hypothetical protein